jgi:hypothetical protein
VFTTDIRYFVCFVFSFLNVGEYRLCFSSMFVAEDEERANLLGGGKVSE